MIDAQYRQVKFRETPLVAGEYENCQFLHCDFTGTDLSGFVFIECEFSECDLSNVPVSGASFREVAFKDCKMIGMRFETCLPFLAPPEFHQCILKFSSFVEMKLQKIRFVKCDLQEVDCTGADLTGAGFIQCDMLGAVFDGTTLEKADFSSAYHYTIDPGVNRIRKAVFSIEGLPGLLGKYDIIIR